MVINFYMGVGNVANRKPPFGVAGIGAGSDIHDVHRGFFNAAAVTKFQSQVRQRSLGGEGARSDASPFLDAEKGEPVRRGTGMRRPFARRSSNPPAIVGGNGGCSAP
jgi:hypothetical protein